MKTKIGLAVQMYRWALAGVVVLSLAACGDNTPTTTAKTEQPTQPAEIAPVVTPAKVDAGGSLLERLVVPDMLGVDLAYFEQFSGIAKRTEKGYKVYEIEGCTLEALTDGKQVHALRLPLSNRCTVDVNPFFEGWAETKAPMAHQMTVGDFEQLVGQDAVYLSDCLTRCGNAFEPSVYASWSGPHAVNYFQTYVTLDNDYDAQNRWEEKLVALKSEDWVMEGKFNCDTQASSDIARPIFSKTRIVSITLGAIPDPINQCP